MNNHYKYVLAVYNEKSFSKAAKKLFVSQPSLSATISKIEREIGSPIFDRSTLPVRLTEVGKMYIQMINESIALQENFISYLYNTRNLTVGNISIGTTHFFAVYFLPRFITGFIKKHSQITVELVESNSTDLVQKLQIGDIDLQIDSRTFDSNLFTSIPVHTERILLAVPFCNVINETLRECGMRAQDIIDDRHMYTGTPYVNLSLFCKEPLLLFTRGNDLHERAVAVCREYDFSPNVAMYLSQLPTIHALTSAGLGASFITDTLIKYSNNINDNIYYYKIKSKHVKRNINVALKKNRGNTELILEFIKELQKSAAQQHLLNNESN